MLDVLQGAQREIEKVPGPAGRIQHPEPGEPLQEAVENPLRPVPRPRRRSAPGRGGLVHQPGDLRPRRLPFRHQRPDDHRLDDHHDLVAVGVVGAELAALVGVETALEQRAQDGRIDVPPVLLRGRVNERDLVSGQGEGEVVVEQAAVEMGYPLEADAPARLHRQEQIAGKGRELARIL